MHTVTHKPFGPVGLGTAPGFSQGQTESVPGTNWGRRAAEKIMCSKLMCLGRSLLLQCVQVVQR